MTIHAFSDDSQGNREAESLFTKLVRQHENNDVPEEDMDVYMDEGTFDDDCGYQIFITHSEK